jgi:hypothetical protein
MDHFAGLDVSVKETSVCILDDAGKIVKEERVASEPQAAPDGAFSLYIRAYWADKPILDGQWKPPVVTYVQ